MTMVFVSASRFPAMMPSSTICLLSRVWNEPRPDTTATESTKPRTQRQYGLTCARMRRTVLPSKFVLNSSSSKYASDTGYLFLQFRFDTRLHIVDLAVDTGLRHQLVVRATLHNFAVIQHQDQVGV